MIGPSDALAAGLSAAAVAAFVRVLLPAPPRLAQRVRPYTLPARSTLGVLPPPDASSVPALHPILGVFGTIGRRIVLKVAGMVDRAGEEALALRLAQAGLFRELAPQERVAAFRLRQLWSLVVWMASTGVSAGILSLDTPRGLALVVLGTLVGATRQRGRLERAVEERRARMRIEIYTVDQLLAMRVRTGGGVVQAVQSLVSRGRGEVVGELREALRTHRAGERLADAFRRIAADTPEPACARTYALLAISEDRGVDLAEGLLALAEDVREARREAMRRSATRRRAAMLVPTIAILAPVMLLFVAAPLPSLLLGFR